MSDELKQWLPVNNSSVIRPHCFTHCPFIPFTHHFLFRAADANESAYVQAIFAVPYVNACA